MTRELKLVVERHSDGCVAYPIGLRGVVVGEGDSYEEAPADVRSANQFHFDTIKASTFRTILTQAGIRRDDFLNACDKN
jgi:hypothetical protein